VLPHWRWGKRATAPMRVEEEGRSASPLAMGQRRPCDRRGKRALELAQCSQSLPTSTER